MGVWVGDVSVVAVVMARSLAELEKGLNGLFWAFLDSLHTL